jgi:MFS family permease
MNASKTEKGPSIGDVLGAAGFAIGLITAWLYLVGWTYAYHYFDRFGIPLLMVDIPKENHFVYGAIVVSQFPVSGLIIFMIVLALVCSWRWLSSKLGRLLAPFGLLVVLAALWLGHQAAIVAAHEQYALQRASDYSAYPRIQVWTKESGKTTDGSQPASTDLATGCYRLLLHNQDRLFLLRPLKGAAAADLAVVIAPWDQIERARVLPDYTSCP